MHRPLSFYLFSFLIIAFTAVLTAVAPDFVSAVTVGPPKIEYRVDPGAVINDTLILINEGDSKQTFWPAFEKFTKIKGERKFLPGEPTALTNWFKLPESVTLEPGERKIIPFTIEVPDNAPPGGHFAVIWWGTAPPEAKEVSIVTRAGILVYLQVSGEVNESAELLEFTTEGERFLFSRMPENFIILFKNNGNTYLKPQGEILLKNIFGATTAKFGVNDINTIILPQNESDLRVSKKFDKPPFAFGLYRAILTLNYGEKPLSFERALYFFVFPWKTVLTALFILAVLFFGLRIIIRKYNDWIIKKYGGQKKRGTKKWTKDG